MVRETAMPANFGEGEETSLDVHADLGLNVELRKAEVEEEAVGLGCGAGEGRLFAVGLEEFNEEFANVPEIERGGSDLHE